MGYTGAQLADSEGVQVGQSEWFFKEILLRSYQELLQSQPRNTSTWTEDVVTTSLSVSKDVYWCEVRSEGSSDKKVRS